MHILAFVSQKGGVSKTTSAINVGACLALDHHKRVLLCDLDPQAAATVCTGHEPEEQHNMYHVMMGDVPLQEILLPTNIPNLTVAPSDIVLAGTEVYLAGQAGWDRILQVELQRVAQEYDYCLIDSPPSLGILSQSCLITADVVIVPLQCQFLSLRALKQLMRIVHRTIQRVKPSIDLLVFRSMFDRRTRQSKKASMEIQRIAGSRLLTTLIHNAADLQNATSKRKTIFEYAKNSRAASEIRALTKEVVDYVEQRYVAQ